MGKRGSKPKSSNDSKKKGPRRPRTQDETVGRWDQTPKWRQPGALAAMKRTGPDPRTFYYSEKSKPSAEAFVRDALGPEADEGTIQSVTKKIAKSPSAKFRFMTRSLQRGA